MAEARFTTGSTMRHVAVMTATSAVGLMSLFLVDAANLFYISLLGAEELAAAVGFAGTIQFFMISVSIGLSIAATAVVSRAIGAGADAEARRLAGASLVILLTVLCFVTVGVWLMRDACLSLLGATGETHAIASRFLAIVLPGMPLLGVGMVTGGFLRAHGDAQRAMYVTLGGGLFAAALDPLFIFGFGLGVDGAAIVSLMSRGVVGGIGLWYAHRTHRAIGRPEMGRLGADAKVLMSIAGPAVATQLSTPFGLAFLTGVVAQYGDDAVAGWAVVGRLTALAFGGIFALSGAVGPIFGQNLGAGLYPRLACTLRDALLFAALYVAVVWVVLFLAQDAIIAAFGLSGNGAAVFSAFATVGAGAYLFTAALFVSNACFNNLGRATWSTGFNWLRDGAVIPGAMLLLGGWAGPEGAVYGQAVAGLVVGTLAAFAAWRHVRALNARAAAGTGAEAEPLVGDAVAAPLTSGRTAVVGSPSHVPRRPLAEPPKSR